MKAKRPTRDERFRAAENALRDIRSMTVAKANNVPTDLLDQQLKSLPDGDFSFINEEAGDWTAERIDDHWIKMAYAIDIERKGGILTFTKVSCDTDGNWTEEDSWSSDEDTPFHETTVAAFLYAGLDEYFLAWAEYWLDCYKSGKDPLEDNLRTPMNDEQYGKNEFLQDCLEAAEMNINVLDPNFAITWR